MQQSLTSAADSFSTSQEIPRISWKSEVPYRIHNSPPKALILNRSTQTQSHYPTA